MHYIIGTHFTIEPPKFRMGVRKETSGGLPAGDSYQLVHIEKTETGLNYHVISSKREKHILAFKTARDADAFIAKHKRENIPDYENISMQDTY